MRQSTLPLRPASCDPRPLYLLRLHPSLVKKERRNLARHNPTILQTRTTGAPCGITSRLRRLRPPCAPTTTLRTARRRPLSDPPPEIARPRAAVSLAPLARSLAPVWSCPSPCATACLSPRSPMLAPLLPHRRSPCGMDEPPRPRSQSAAIRRSQAWMSSRPLPPYRIRSVPLSPLPLPSPNGWAPSLPQALADMPPLVASQALPHPQPMPPRLRCCSHEAGGGARDVDLKFVMPELLVKSLLSLSLSLYIYIYIYISSPIFVSLRFP